MYLNAILAAGKAGTATNWASKRIIFNWCFVNPKFQVVLS